MQYDSGLPAEPEADLRALISALRQQGGRLAPDREITFKDIKGMLRRRRWILLGTLAVAVALGLAASLLPKPLYEASAKLLAEPRYYYGGVDLKDPLAAILTTTQQRSVETQMEMLRSEPIVEEAFRRLGGPPDQRPFLNVSNIKDTDVIEVSATGPISALAAKAPDLLMQTYVEKTQEFGLREVRKARVFVEQQQSIAVRELERAENALRRFKQRNHLVELDKEQASQLEQMMGAEQALDAAKRELVDTRGQIAQTHLLLARLPQTVTSQTSTIPNPEVATVRDQIQKLGQDRLALLQDYKPKHPKVQAVDAQLSALQARLQGLPPTMESSRSSGPNPAREQLQGQLTQLLTRADGLDARVGGLRQQVAEHRKQMAAFPAWQVELARLTRQRDQAEAGAKLLGEKLTNLRISEQSKPPIARILEGASVAVPVRPRKAVNMALAIVLGSFLGVGLAFLWESLDDRIHSGEECEQLTGLPSLAHVPLAALPRSTPAGRLPSRCPSMEAYRVLRSGIGFAAVDTPVHTLLVTSGTAGEGRTTTAINLAIAMAMEGKRVLLVDADLRRPSIAPRFNVPPTPGLTEVLTGQSAVDQALQVTGIEGLMVLPAGTIPPNPTELLNTGAMGRLLHDLGEACDMVIVDAPPALPVADAQVLSTKVDGVLLVVEMGKAKKDAVDQTRALLDRAHARILGAVMNKMAPDDPIYGYESSDFHHRHRYAPNGFGSGAPFSTTALARRERTGDRR
jgi:succinoglycan biosynthesis transport protein ExoP